MMFLPPLVDDDSCSPLLWLSKHARKLGEPQLPFTEQKYPLEYLKLGLLTKASMRRSS